MERPATRRFCSTFAVEYGDCPLLAGWAPEFRLILPPSAMVWAGDSGPFGSLKSPAKHTARRAHITTCAPVRYPWIMPNGKLGPKPKKSAKKKAAKKKGAKRAYTHKTRATPREYRDRRNEEQRAPVGDHGELADGTVRKYASQDEVRRNIRELPVPQNPIKLGRPTTYSDEYPQALLNYYVDALERIQAPIHEVAPSTKFIQEPIELPMLCSFAVKIGVHSGTLNEWAKKHPFFSEAIKVCKDIQQQILVHMGSHGAYAPAISIFALKNLADWHDKQEVGLTVIAPTLNFDDQDKGA